MVAFSVLSPSFPDDENSLTDASWIMPVDKSNAKVRQMFGAIAPHYDRMNHVLSLNTDHYWRWRTARLLARSDGGPILDVCTGTGDLAFAFRRRLGQGVPIIGADFCPEMLEIGERKKLRVAPSCDNISFIEADAQQLPFPAETFSIVAVAFGLRNVADTDLGLHEMTRVCRTGGTVAVLEFSQPGWQPFALLYGIYFRHVLPRLGQWLARNDHSAYSYLPESVGEFPSGEALLERMRNVGLHDTRLHRFTLGVATLYVGTKGDASS
jgi:demethylmenaquinone methyltransferase / 2-methoxy-6-polyprenyl-1,4-benzoquinol methylase